MERVSPGVTIAATPEHHDHAAMLAAHLLGFAVARYLLKLDGLAECSPQEAVTVYRKMISSDNVNVFISGCVSGSPIRTLNSSTLGPSAVIMSPA